MAKEKTRLLRGGLQKVPTGIEGLDEITNGGLPKGRPTLVCGGAGSGKTLFPRIEFLCGGQPGLMNLGSSCRLKNPLRN